MHREKLSLFYCFISLKKTKSVSMYKQLNAKRDLKQINYLSDINWQKMAERGADVSARDIMFAHMKTYKITKFKYHSVPQHTTIYLYIFLYISTHHSAFSPLHSAPSTGKSFSTYISTLITSIIIIQFSC
jgi:hypothetical protein